MIDGGVTANHSNAIEFTDIPALDAMTSYAIHMGVNYRVASPTSTRRIVSKMNSGGTQGWELRTLGSRALRMRHNSSNSDSTGTLTNGTRSPVSMIWTGVNLTYYIDAILDVTNSFSQSITDVTDNFTLLNQDGLGVGGQIALNHIMIYANRVHGSFEVDEYASGKTVPDLENITFWFKGTAVPGLDEISLGVPTEQGTVALLSDPTDSDFGSQGIGDFEQMATHRLMRRRTLAELHTVTVPWQFLSNELMEIMNLSHQGIPLPASKLENLGGVDLPLKLGDKWRRRFFRLIAMSSDPLKKEVTLTLKDHESFAATYFSTDLLTSKTTSQQEGLARMDLGGTLTIERSSTEWAEQETNLITILGTLEEDGQKFAKVGPFSELINERGFLAQDATKNFIQNSAFDGGTTNWTLVESTVGNIVGNIGIYRAFPKSASDTSFSITGETSQENYISQTGLSMLSADSFARVSFVHSSPANEAAEWALQRSSDSFWWNDSSETWAASLVWNQTSLTGNDGTNEIAVRSASKPIDISSNQTWTLRFGIEDSTNIHRIYQTDVTPGKLLHSPIVTPGSATVTTDDDVVKRVLDSTARQLVHAGRGTLSFRLTAVQDGENLVDGDELALIAWEYGTTAGQDYDIVKYQKLASQNVRFAFERYISGSLDARATNDISIVAGTTYEVEAVWTSDSDDELDLPARTLRLRVDKVNGTDAAASASHSSSQKDTTIYFGCSPDAGDRTAMNYLSLIRFQPIIIADEQKIS